MKNENFCVPEREELPQEEKYDEKTRGPELQKMAEEGEENGKVREPESYDGKFVTAKCSCINYGATLINSSD